MSPIDAALARAWEAHKSGNVAAAEQAYRQAVSQSPGHATAWCYLGLACYDLGRYVEAEQAYRHALRLQPQFPIALNNLGNALKAQGRLDEAIKSFERAVEQDAGYVNAHFNLGTTCRLAGDAERGWREFLWREKSPGFAAPQVSASRWNGESLEGKSILLWAEQGLGDTLQFVRYAAAVKARVDGAELGRVFVAVQKPLLALLAKLRGVDELVALGELSDSAKAADYHAPLMSLPALPEFSQYAEAASFGRQAGSLPYGPPYLRPDELLTSKWREKLSSLAGYKVGIAWSGNPQHADDRRRSIPLELFAPLATLEGVRLVNLQKGPGSEQAALTAGRVPMFHPGSEIDAAGAFTDTAAIVGQLDLVVTADTAIAHLAGALNVPVWTALSDLPDWRWGTVGDTTPWYPSMRLFRQSRPGQWEDAFERITAALWQRARVKSAGQATAAWRKSHRLLHSGSSALKACRHGPMLYNRHDAYIGRSLEDYGEFSGEEVDLFRQLLKPGDVVIEAGANIGAHTVPLAQMVGSTGAVHAFEPQRILHQMLCANVALNGLKNVHAHHAALGAEAGSITVPSLDYDRPNNFGGLSLGGTAPGETVPLRMIDELELPRVNLIKADVEGMEHEVLSGGRATIERCRPLLYVEDDRAEKSKALAQLIASFGYRMYRHTPPLFRPRNYFENPVNVFGGVVSKNLLCLHASVPSAITGLPEVRAE
jgi:FkbM family methyltransferase